MEIRVENDLVEFVGYLSEKTSAEDIQTGLQKALQASHSGVVRIDFSKVERANSVGILKYLKVFESLHIKAVYERAPIWLVEQFNVIQEFLHGDVTVASLYARFFSLTTNKHVTQLLHVGKDVPLLSNYKDFEIELKDESGQMLEPDFDPQLYFSFLTTQDDQQ